MAFDYNKYIHSESKYVRLMGDNEFEIIVGSTRESYKDCMDRAALNIIRSTKFHLKKETVGCICEVVSYDNDTNLYLEDEEEVLMKVVQNQIHTFSKNYPFSPKGFSLFIKRLMRPISKSTCYENKRSREKKLF